MSRSKNSHKKVPSVLHGPKTTEALVQQNRPHHPNGDGRSAGPQDVSVAERAKQHERELRHEVNSGKFRLAEHRVQHDEADHNSEKTRLAKDAKRHRHGNAHGESKGGVDRV